MCVCEFIKTSEIFFIISSSKKKKMNRASNAVVSFFYCITYRRLLLLNIWNKILPVFELNEWEPKRKRLHWVEKSLNSPTQMWKHFISLFRFWGEMWAPDVPDRFHLFRVTIRSISTSSTQSHRKESGLEYMFYKKWFVFPQRSLTLCLIQKVDELCAI